MLDSSKKLSFSEFPPVSTEQWEEVISKDLKGADYKQKLRWKTGEGVEVLPFYRRENLEDLSHETVPFRDERTWKIWEFINNNNAADAERHLLKALENNVDGLFIDVTDSSFYQTDVLVRLLKQVNEKSASLHLGKSAFTKELPGLLADAFSEAGIDGSDIPVSFAFDPFAMAVKTGKLLDSGEWVTIQNNLPGKFTALSVNADVYGDAGATITQQLAYALATGNEYLGKAEQLELSLEQVAGSITFNFSIGSEYFPELAKIRAFRLLWNKVLEEYKEGLSKEAPARIHAKTSFWNKTVYDAHNNLLRCTTEAMSAALGGADAITVHPFDEINADASEFSSRIARNIQHLLKEESYLNKVADPGAGSYYIEVLTEKISEESWSEFQEIEAKGGFEQCIREGFIQQQINKAQAKKRETVATRRTTIVGVNNYPAPHKEGITLDNKQVPDYSFTHDAFDSVETIEQKRAASDFERLRNSVESKEKIPYVQLVPFGNLRMRKARSLFSLNFFGGAGFRVEDHNGFPDLDAAVDHIKEHKPDLVVLCSSDPEYKDWVDPFCKAMKSLSNTPFIVLAGYPKDDIEAFTEAGIDEFIHIRSNMLEVLTQINAKLEEA